MALPLANHLPTLLSRLAKASSRLLFLDFDGTLTPIVSRPQEARLDDAVRRTLDALARRPDTTVAIISGRGLADLVPRIGLDNVIYSGNHGLEIRGPGWEHEEPLPEGTRDRLDRLSATLRQRLEDIPGAWVDHKRLTLSVHYRQTPEIHWPQVRDAVAAAVAECLPDWRFHEGNRVFEVRPGHLANKGTSCRRILDHVGGAPATLYAGDDRTDEDAFAALPEAITIKVGPAGETAAQYYVDSPAEVQAFLVRLESALPAGRI